MKHQVGGVGFYPTSGSPFVHMDTGNVRAWPRMTRAQLKKVFPDGRTLHLPTDGKPLSNEGRAYAQAQWTKCRTVPCDGDAIYESAPAIMLADNADARATDTAPIPAIRPRTLNGGTATIMMASAEEPAQRVVPTFEVVAPVPCSAGPKAASMSPPCPRDRHQGLRRRRRTSPGDQVGPHPACHPFAARQRGPDRRSRALAAIDQPLPKPRVLMSPNDRRDGHRLRGDEPRSGRRAGAEDDHRARERRGAGPAGCGHANPPVADQGAAARHRQRADRLARRPRNLLVAEGHVRHDLQFADRQRRLPADAAGARRPGPEPPAEPVDRASADGPGGAQRSTTSTTPWCSRCR